MPEENPPEKQSSETGILRRLKRYFFTGLLVVVPFWGTYLVLKTLLVTLEGVLGNLMQDEGLYYIPGFGTLLLLCLIFLVGLFTTNIFGRKLLRFWERLLDRLPLVRNVYSMLKSVVDTVSSQTGGKKNFSRVVLIEYPRKGTYTYGFVTGEMRGSIENVCSPTQKIVSVFVPTVPNPISGFIIMVPEYEVIPLTISVEEGMKIVFSVGLYCPVLALDKSQLPQARSASGGENA